MPADVTPPARDAREAISPVGLLLLVMGAMCPKCGHGTRATSKRWAKCTQCGERVERRSLAPVAPAPEG